MFPSQLTQAERIVWAAWMRELNKQPTNVSERVGTLPSTLERPWRPSEGRQR